MGKPWRGSKHNRGVAIDLTLIDLATGKELAMPTPFDCLTYPSHPDYRGLPDSVIQNRDLLIAVLGRHGFSVAKNEWWHFDYTAGVQYELLDIPQAELAAFVHKNWRK